MGKKSIFLSYILYTFSFLYSGTVIHSPHYTSGNPVASFVVTSVFLLVYTSFAGRYFESRVSIASAMGGRCFSIVISVLAAVIGAYIVNEYVANFGVFAEYYAKPLTKYFGAFAVVACSVYGACRGNNGVSGFAGLAGPMFVLWTLAGGFAFITTKEFVLPEVPFMLPLNIGVGGFLKNTILVCLDITLLAAVVFDGESGSDTVTPRKGLFTGACMYVVVAGGNLLKNLFMFGEEFASQIPDPDLAAIRLVPMVDLPEISVIVNSFACIVKISVYFLASLSASKRAFGESLCHKKFGAVSVAICIVFVCALQLAGESCSEIFSGIRLASIAFCAAMCLVFWSSPKIRQNNTR